jgi:hypothetical protein
MFKNLNNLKIYINKNFPKILNLIKRKKSSKTEMEKSKMN